MKKLPIALLLAASALFAGCKSNESKPDDGATAPAATTAAPVAQAAPAKPECAPEPPVKKSAKTTKKSSKKTEATQKNDTAAVDCVPAKPKTESTATARTIETKPGAAAAPVAAAGGPGSPKTGTACNPCSVKSRDGTFDGEVYGNIPANSKWAQLKIGMHQSEVERILGVTSNIRAYVTGKAWIPFYFGNDAHRYEAVYSGQGSVAYTGGGLGGGQGTLMMINFDPKVQ